MSVGSNTSYTTVADIADWMATDDEVVITITSLLPGRKMAVNVRMDGITPQTDRWFAFHKPAFIMSANNVESWAVRINEFDEDGQIGATRLCRVTRWAPKEDKFTKPSKKKK